MLGGHKCEKTPTVPPGSPVARALESLGKKSYLPPHPSLKRKPLRSKIKNI